ncbi:MAG: hypothetical protein Q9P01_11090 [Anaerolineae bacterium]|nr:hypothetical protein [Anaerolineae bacterium]MDQ7035350.1 hypothetical protein [Anaerolineae bacterium]
MKKIVFLVLGLVIGFFFGEVLRRQKMACLQILEEKEARRKATNAKYEREWQKELANMPFDERMDYELFEATMPLDNWMPYEGDDNAET